MNCRRSCRVYDGSVSIQWSKGFRYRIGRTSYHAVPEVGCALCHLQKSIDSLREPGDTVVSIKPSIVHITAIEEFDGDAIEKNTKSGYSLGEPNNRLRFLLVLTGIEQRKHDRVHRNSSLRLRHVLVGECSKCLPLYRDLQVAHTNVVWPRILWQRPREQRAEWRPSGHLMQLRWLRVGEDMGGRCARYGCRPTTRWRDPLCRRRGQVGVGRRREVVRRVRVYGHRRRHRHSLWRKVIVPWLSFI